MKLTIRHETEADFQKIYELTKAAFAPMSFSQGDEPELINKLRNCGALALSLVAQNDSKGEIIGHVALSPVTHSNSDTLWFGLGPISVAPEHQRSGIGTKLIAAAKEWLLEQGAEGCILVGNPNYYSRHGFVLSPEHCPLKEPKEFFMVWCETKEIPIGNFAFHNVFYDS